MDPAGAHGNTVETKMACGEDCRGSYDLSNRQLIMLEEAEIPPDATIVSLANNSICCIDEIGQFAQIRWLELQNNQLNDVRPLVALGFLEYLDVRNNQLGFGDVLPLRGMHIIHLRLQANPLDAVVNKYPLILPATFWQVWVIDGEFVTDWVRGAAREFASTAKLPAEFRIEIPETAAKGWCQEARLSSITHLVDLEPLEPDVEAFCELLAAEWFRVSAPGESFERFLRMRRAYKHLSLNQEDAIWRGLSLSEFLSTGMIPRTGSIPLLIVAAWLEFRGKAVESAEHHAIRRLIEFLSPPRGSFSEFMNALLFSDLGFTGATPEVNDMVLAIHPVTKRLASGKCLRLLGGRVVLSLEDMDAVVPPSPLIYDATNKFWREIDARTKVVAKKLSPRNRVFRPLIVKPQISKGPPRITSRQPENKPKGQRGGADRRPFSIVRDVVLILDTTPRKFHIRLENLRSGRSSFMVVREDALPPGDVCQLEQMFEEHCARIAAEHGREERDDTPE